MKTVGVVAMVAMLMGGCGTRDFTIQRVDGSTVGAVQVDRWLEEESILVQSGGVKSLYVCKWSIKVCREAK